MKTRKSKLKLFVWVALLLPLFLTLNPQEVQASHFRYGHLTWQPLTGNTVRFTLTCAFRRDGFPGSAVDGFVAVGDTFNEDIGITNLMFGDGFNTGELEFKVTAIDPANNWCLARALEPTNYSKATIDHTYPSANNGGDPWVAEINTCCRTLIEQNNPNGNYRVLTYVETATGNTSPSSSLPAIVNMPFSANATFVVPAADPDPNTVIRYRLATPTEAGNGTFNQPTGLSIDPVTGVVNWNTLANAVIGGLYSCQVIIEDRSLAGALKTQVAVDFLIFVTPQSSPCDLDNPPSFVSPSPTCGSTLNVTELQHLTFTVQASDPDAGNYVTLNTGGLPSGATMTPVLPTTGTPVSAVFNWNPPVGSAGSYVVTFSATDSCQLQALCSYTIHVSACSSCHLSVRLNKVNPSCCGGGCNGTISAIPSNGTAPFSYLWSDGQTTQTAHNLCGQTYTVTVTDARGCKKTTSGSLILTPPIKITPKVTQVQCKGSCSGSITLTVTGGQPQFTYAWSNGATTKDISSLCPGTYTVIVTDSRGCSAKSTRNVTEARVALGLTIAHTDNKNCSLTNCNGTATANPTGGVAPYKYLWSTGASTKAIGNLCAGTYTCTVTDKNLCTRTETVIITGAGLNFTLNPVIIDNSNCGNNCNGSIEVIPSVGSVNDYSYQWLSGEITNIISGKCAGSYTVTVSSQPGCSKSAQYTINDDISPVNAQCSTVNDESFNNASDGSVTVSPSGGDGTYTYLWSDGQTTQTATNLTAGTYTVTVTSGNNCTATCFTSVITIPSRYATPLNGEGKQVSVYPNPFSNVLTVNVLTDEVLTITVRDAMGRIVKEFANVDKTLQMPGNWNNGMYFITVENSNATFRKIFRTVRVE